MLKVMAGRYNLIVLLYKTTFVNFARKFLSILNGYILLRSILYI